VITEKQREYFEKYKELHTYQKVADFFNVRRDTVEEAIKSAKRKCEKIAFEMDLIQEKRRNATEKHSAATAGQLMELVKKQDFKCALSGEDITDPNLASLDHIVPVSDGGGNEVDNLQWVLSEVNRMKGTLTQERFIELCCKIASHHAKTT
jgi:predicted DNA-binding protein YlxM (UPF0122 family)